MDRDWGKNRRRLAVMTGAYSVKRRDPADFLTHPDIQTSSSFAIRLEAISLLNRDLCPPVYVLEQRRTHDRYYAILDNLFD